MKRAWRTIRSLVLWVVSGVHFAVVCTFRIVLGTFVDPRKDDWLQRLFCRNVLRLAGARVEVRCSPRFDPAQTCLFISNHVNIFDTFVVYAAIPQFLRGFELESHFKIPIYGWLMSRFGNIPVPDSPNREGLRIMAERAKAAIDSGISLIAFAEGSRTRDGHLRPFKKGIFNIAQRLGVPLVPVSMVGSFEFFRTGHWMLHPGKIIVYVHDPIDVTPTGRDGAEALRQRVQEIVSGPVEESLKKSRKA